MSRVFIKQVKDYETPVLRNSLFEMLDALDGGRIQPGNRVLIKPNLLTSASPQKAILTHPAVVKAVVEYVLDRRGRVIISDSPATGSFKRILKTGGFLDALQGLNVEFQEFKTPISVDIGSPFRNIEMAEEVFKADIVINLPKLKTHSQMLLTLGVKNLFGCIVGFKKPQWHMRTGVDREMFGRLLVRIYQAVRPSMTLMDGIVGLEGQGPSFSGTPKPLGVLMGSEDTVAVDITVCRMLGIEPDQVLTNKLATELGARPASIHVEGSLPAIDDFKFPEISDVLFGPPRFHGFFRRHLLQRPVSIPSQCKLCGECWEYCPAKAIRLENKKNIAFDYDECIRCYCCIEVCPYGALRAEEPPLGKIYRKIVRATSRTS